MTATMTPTAGAVIAPYPSAPLCLTHDNSTFHTLWNDAGCHYDQEHGTSPFTPQVAAAFPEFDLFALLGNVEIGHTNPSSPMENTHKHGGFKWQVSTAAPQGCLTGFENGTVAIDAYAIQYHAFGVQGIELESRTHSAAGMLRQCKSDNPSDKGYVYFASLQDYGQIVAPYQGTVLQYPHKPSPSYAAGFGPYWATSCFGAGLPGCRASLQLFIDRNLNALAVVSSKPTGSGARPAGYPPFRLLFRSRDEYQALDSSDLVHPFTWRFICGGVIYNPVGCRWNNSTTTIHEIAGIIPSSWDNLSGFDTDPRVGRITASGYTNQYGALDATCTTAGGACYPIVLVNAFVGKYSSELSAGKVSNPTPLDTPERDFYFCGGVQCSETTPGAVPSGWVGSEN